MLTTPSVKAQATFLMKSYAWFPHWPNFVPLIAMIGRSGVPWWSRCTGIFTSAGWLSLKSVVYTVNYSIKDDVLNCWMQRWRSSVWTKLYVGFVFRLICSFGCSVWLLRCTEANHIYLNPHCCGYYFVTVIVISFRKRYSDFITVLLLLLFHELYSQKKYPWRWQAAELVAFHSGLPQCNL